MKRNLKYQILKNYKKKNNNISKTINKHCKKPAYYKVNYNFKINKIQKILKILIN